MANGKRKVATSPASFNHCFVETYSLLACSREAMGGHALGRYVTSNDSVGGDAARGHVLTVRADDVFEHAVLVEEPIGVPVADDGAVIVNAYEIGMRKRITIVHGCKAPIAIDEPALDVPGISRQDVAADDHPIVIESARISHLRAREIRYAQECAVTPTLE